MLGLDDVLDSRDLSSARAWFAKRLEDPAAHMVDVLRRANVKYCVMTNEPFRADQAALWLEGRTVPDQLKAALRVDPVLAGDWDAVQAAITARGHPPSPAGLYAFLQQFVDVMSPVYLMASTPAGFTVDAAAVAACVSAPPGTRVVPAAESMPPETMLGVTLRLAADTGLAVAIKVGAVRGANPQLGAGGDSVEVCNLSWLAALCGSLPQQKFLVTVLSTENQHELCVMARTFPNLHVYGCWWYCNLPNVVEEVTTTRVQLLGTQFTAQHSDARVFEQLLYKFSHARTSIARVLTKSYAATLRSGWRLRVSDVWRDVEQLFGGSYEAFLGAKVGKAATDALGKK